MRGALHYGVTHDQLDLFYGLCLCVDAEVQIQKNTTTFRLPRPARRLLTVYKFTIRIVNTL